MWHFNQEFSLFQGMSGGFFFLHTKDEHKERDTKKKKKKRGGEREEKIVPAKALTGYIGPFIFSCMNVLIFFSFVFFFVIFFFILILQFMPLAYGIEF